MFEEVGLIPPARQATEVTDHHAPNGGTDGDEGRAPSIGRCLPQR